MGRIRLQICVLPWEQPGPSPTSSAQTRQETVKWCEPCTEHTSMQVVCDKIEEKWGRMFKPSMGPLHIRHLKTAYGDFVDLEEQFVGDLFDDRGADGNIRNSILEVHRYPPRPETLETLQRFTSLAPTSSARPRKRPLELPSQPYPLQNPRNLQREIPSIEEWDAENRTLFSAATKRQRTHEPGLNGTSGAHQLFSMREERGGEQYHSFQISGTQESIHQVLDSQKSPRKKHLNPYGTPTSLPIIRPQESISGNEIDLSAIPDSPLGRETMSVSGAVGGAMQLDRESTKSESPELRASVHEVRPADPIEASGKQSTTSANSPKPSTTSFIFNSTSRPVSISHIVDEYAKNHGPGVRQTGENEELMQAKKAKAKDELLAEAKRNEELEQAKEAKEKDELLAEAKQNEELEQAKEAKEKEGELAEAKRNDERMVNAERLAEDKEISERLARERQIRETTLAEEANKVMLAAEGAKQIKAEMKEKANAKLREMATKKQANEEKAADQVRKAQGKEHEKKARLERLALEKAQQHANIKSKDVKQRAQQAETARETATALKEHGQKSLPDRDVQKLRDTSEIRSRSSTTPSAPQNVSGPKRSMTPIVPGSSVTKSSHQNSLGSSPSSNRSSGNMDAPLRSALRPNSSVLRRSVSSVSFDVPSKAKRNDYIPTLPNPKSLKEINNELATKQSSAENLLKTPPRTASNAPSKTPMKILVPKKASDSRITKTPAKNGKVQMKLNVTRQAKKLKDRVVDPPITRMSGPNQEIFLSSGEDSSMSEEPVWQTGNAKAGPSSRKPIFPVTTSHGKKTAEVKSSTPIDPIIHNIKVERDKAAASATLPRSNTKSDTTSLQKSTSRSPAQALSETYSLSSDSASNSDSDSNSEEELQAPSSKGSIGSTNGKLAPDTTKGGSKAVGVGAKQSKGHLQSKASSQSCQASSSRPRSTVSTQSDGKHVDQAADKQLQLESGQLVPSSPVKQASSTTNGSADKNVINQGLDHAGRLPNGIRPAYYKYPGLSELQKLPRAVTPVVMKPRLETFSSQPLSALPLGQSDSDRSSSDSDDSSSSSDGDEDVDGITSQTSSKRKSGGYPGMRGVMKLANAVRSKFGPA